MSIEGTRYVPRRPLSYTYRNFRSKSSVTSWHRFVGGRVSTDWDDFGPTSTR